MDQKLLFTINREWTSTLADRVFALASSWDAWLLPLICSVAALWLWGVSAGLFHHRGVARRGRERWSDLQLAETPGRARFASSHSAAIRHPSGRPGQRSAPPAASFRAVAGADLAARTSRSSRPVLPLFAHHEHGVWRAGRGVLLRAPLVVGLSARRGRGISPASILARTGQVTCSPRSCSASAQPAAARRPRYPLAPAGPVHWPRLLAPYPWLYAA